MIKGFTVYRLKEQLNFDIEKLAERAFTPCGEFDVQRSGFSPFHGDGEPTFVLKTGNMKAVMIKTQKKAPEPCEVKRRCKTIEQRLSKAENRKLKKSEKDTIKTEVVMEMLPMTFPKDPETTLIWTIGDYLFVGEPTFQKAEEKLGMIRATLGTLRVRPVQTVNDVTDRLTEMVKKDFSDTATLGMEVIIESGDGGKIAFTKESVYDADTESHLVEGSGAVVTKLELEYDGRLTFKLAETMEFSGLKADKEMFNDSESAQASDILLMNEIKTAFDYMIGQLGGEKLEDQE